MTVQASWEKLSAKIIKNVCLSISQLQTLRQKNFPTSDYETFSFEEYNIIHKRLFYLAMQWGCVHNWNRKLGEKCYAMLAKFKLDLKLRLNTFPNLLHSN